MQLVDLKRALRLPIAPRLALVGAGGKTTALFAIARLYQSPVLVTTTTHLAESQLALADRYIEIHSPDQLEQLGESPLSGITLISGQPAGEGKVSGLDQETLDRIRIRADEWQIPLLIEADGSRMRPLKAPGDYEPVIPSFVDQVVIIAGMNGLGQPLTREWVHRPERFAVLAGIPLGEPISTEALARVLLHPEGGLKNIPGDARRSFLLTQTNLPDLQSQAYVLAQELLPQVASVVISSSGEANTTRPGSTQGEPDRDIEPQVFSVVERVSGIILAAGASQRMGQPKQLLDWHGQPFVRAVARSALSAGLSPVIVVTGAQAVEVGVAIEDLDLQVVFNPEWEAGQATSIRKGLLTRKQEIGAAVFLLADQPQISPNLIRALIERHATTLAPIIAPLAGGRHANPVLFDQVTFPALEKLEGDIGGRAVFAKYPIEWLEWQDENILLDVDSPEDYRKLLNSS